MIAFIDDHRGGYGVEPICRVLPIAPSTYHAHVARRCDRTRLCLGTEVRGLRLRSVCEAEPLERSEDVVGGFVPWEGCRIGVVVIEEGDDVGAQASDAAIDAKPGLTLCDKGKEALDSIEPQTLHLHGHARPLNMKRLSVLPARAPVGMKACMAP